MTDEERQVLLRALSESAALLEDAVASVPESRWMLSPFQEQWSPADVLEHLILTEDSVGRNVMNGLPNGNPAQGDIESARRFDSIILNRVPDRRPGKVRMPAPEFLRPCGNCADQQRSVLEFRDKRESLRRFVETTDLPLRARVARHPALGDIDGYQWILFLAAHCERHAKQLQQAGAGANPSQAGAES